MLNNVYIMAAGKSTRFGKPKIFETIKYNYPLLKKYFKNINVVIDNSQNITKKDLGVNVNIIKDSFRNGSGRDVQKIVANKGDSYICWSDVFLNEENIKAIIETDEKNAMTITYINDPYISIIINDNDYMVSYTKNNKFGWNDNSIFKCSKDILNYNYEEFMDIASKVKFKCLKTLQRCYFFNTQEELEEIKELI